MKEISKRCYFRAARWRGRATRPWPHAKSARNEEGKTCRNIERRACVPYRDRRAWTFSALARARPDRSLLRPRSSPGISDGAFRQLQHRSGMHLSQKGWSAEASRCFWALGCTCTLPECAEDLVPRKRAASADFLCITSSACVALSVLVRFKPNQDDSPLPGEPPLEPSCARLS